MVAGSSSGSPLETMRFEALPPSRVQNDTLGTGAPDHQPVKLSLPCPLTDDRIVCQVVDYISLRHTAVLYTGTSNRQLPFASRNASSSPQLLSPSLPQESTSVTWGRSCTITGDTA